MICLEFLFGVMITSTSSESQLFIWFLWLLHELKQTTLLYYAVCRFTRLGNRKQHFSNSLLVLLIITANNSKNKLCDVSCVVLIHNYFQNTLLTLSAICGNTYSQFDTVVGTCLVQFHTNKRKRCVWEINTRWMYFILIA